MPLRQRSTDFATVTNFEQPLPRGTVLDGRYRVDELLGEGGMGWVFAGEDLRLGRKVAIKIAKQLDEALRLSERLFAEAKAAARAEHPAVVLAFAYGTDLDLGADFIVMERLRGETLGQRIARAVPLSIAFSLRVALDTCDALIAVHEAGVIHRDLKPTNIFLASRGRRVDEIKLLDFGVAKHLNMQTLTATGQAWGTPMYMAPEQVLDSKRVDPRCDLYALGVVLFECLTGVVPFSGQNALALAFQIVHGQTRNLRSHRTDVPEAFAEVVTRCMHTDPEQRFPDARSLYEALTRVADIALP